MVLLTLQNSSNATLSMNDAEHAIFKREWNSIADKLKECQLESAIIHSEDEWLLRMYPKPKGFLKKCYMHFAGEDTFLICSVEEFKKYLSEELGFKVKSDLD